LRIVNGGHRAGVAEKPNGALMTCWRCLTPNSPQISAPWALNPESGGPEPEVRKPGIAYRTDLS
jgi:hypothetical protein